MATRGGYFPVEPEDRGNNRLLEGELGMSSTDDSARSTNKNQGFKSNNCISTWSFSLIIIGLSVMFLLGVCIGFYVRELQKDETRAEDVCGTDKVKQESLQSKLGDFHETLIYYIRGEKIREFVSERGPEDPVTGSDAEKHLADVVLEKFHEYKIDSIDEEEHDVWVTGADPERPNHLAVFDQKGGLLQDLELINRLDIEHNSSLSDQWRYPLVVFSPAAEVQGQLVYGHFGRDADMVMLQALGVKLKGSVLLLRLGKLSLADKIMNCELYGVRGVILYWEPQDVEEDLNSPSVIDYIPFTSAATYSIDLLTVWKPSIPCQTISFAQAKVLMSLLQQSSNHTAAPSTWQGSLTTSYVVTRTSDNLIAHLSVHNKPYKQRIRNIISTVQGTEEPDRYVIVGAPQSSLPGQSHDVLASSSILIQLAHSFHFVHNKHHWKPRRTIKLVSWGGAGFSNDGMHYYIKTHSHLLDRRAVTYFDLSQLVLGNGSIIANIPASLNQLIQETTFDVPDPNNAEQTLQMSWKMLNEKNDNQKGNPGEIIPVESYHSDKTQNPFLHVLGVPEVKIQYRASPGSHDSLAVMTSVELGHHYKYHITVTRILVKSLLILLDSEILPFNLQIQANAIQSTMGQTNHVLEQCLPDEEQLFAESDVNLCGEITEAAGSLLEASNLFLERSDTQRIRVVNDILMSFERLFIVHSNGKSQHILYPTQPDGSLVQAAELCEMVQVTQSRNVTTELSQLLTSILKKALIMFRFSA